MNPFSRALTDFHAGISNATFTIQRDDGFQQCVPVASFFESENFPSIETLALNLCQGSVLDIGSAAGRHTLELLRRGFKVTSLDILPEMEQIMRDRGQTDIIIADVLEFSNRRFDTLLMLMNGIGMVGTIDGLERFLKHVHQLIEPGGQILCDSIDVYATEDVQHSAYRETNLAAGRPAGQQAFKIDYKGENFTQFDWLHIDFPSLSKTCESTGWIAELVESQNNGHYLCKIVQQPNRS